MNSNFHILLDHVRMEFGKRRVFDSLSCRFPHGRISVILGGSGSGKSTILRLIGGLLRPRSGAVFVDGVDITHLSYRQLNEVRRKMGMLFQGGALLDSYSVFDNVALPLRENGRHTEAEVRTSVREILEAVGVNDADNLLPGQLSGGMLRRVALARAMVRKPEVLLCDEPFSGLDPVSLRQIESLLVKISKQFGMTVIVVSHDLPSTIRMADHVLLIVQRKTFEGSPAELLKTDDADAAEFLRDGLGHLEERKNCG